MIKKRIREGEDKGREFYLYIMVDLDDVTIIIERFGRAIKRLFIEKKMDIKNVKLYAFSSTSSEKIIDHCQKGGFRFYMKPSKAEALDMFRHMASEEEDGGSSRAGSARRNDLQRDNKNMPQLNKEVTLDELKKELTEQIMN